MGVHKGSGSIQPAYSALNTVLNFMDSVLSVVNTTGPGLAIAQPGFSSRIIATSVSNSQDGRLGPAIGRAQNPQRGGSVRRAWSHERSPMGKCEWLTPPEILRALGRFDLDPCASTNRPWPTAKRHFTIADDGLSQAWVGRVWLNPPYGRETGRWLAKLAKHGDGIALIFARTETRMFFDHIWEQASAVLFLRGRLTFYNADGTRPTNSGGAPSCLVAYGRRNASALAASGLLGKLIALSSASGEGI